MESNPCWRIAVIAADRKPGGIQLAMEQYVRALVDMGSVVKLALHPNAPLVKTIAEDPALSAIVEMHALTSMQIRMLKNVNMIAPSLKRFLSDCDAIIVNNNALCGALSRAGRPLIAVCHTEKSKGLDAAARIICLSRGIKARFVENGISDARLAVIPHYYESRQATSCYKMDHKDQFIVAAAGRLVANKNFKDFIDAASLILSKYPDIAFWLAGEGEEHEALRRYALKKNIPVVFKGWMDMSVLARSADVFCLLSRRESFGFSLCEMMDGGVPCIATAANGPRDILDEGQFGMMFAVGDVDILAKNVIALYEDQVLRDELSQKAFTRIHSPVFSRQTFQEKLSVVLTGLVER